MKVLFIGDIVGSPGRKAAASLIKNIISEYSLDFCVANAENAAGGSGITSVVARELIGIGIDALTLGNHTWSKREVLNFIDSDRNVLRPANFPPGTPGHGTAIIAKNGLKLGLLQLQGRIFMDSIDCPFRVADKELVPLKKETAAILVDMHAETTSEKCAMAWHLDGRVSCVIGTHTHVQTADERILPCGTAFITDAGMTGPYEGIIGMDKDLIVRRFLTRMPEKFELAQGKTQFNAVVVEIDEKTGKSILIKRINEIIQ